MVLILQSCRSFFTFSPKISGTWNAGTEPWLEGGGGVFPYMTLTYSLKKRWGFLHFRIPDLFGHLVPCLVGKCLSLWIHRKDATAILEVGHNLTKRPLVVSKISTLQGTRKHIPPGEVGKIIDEPKCRREVGDTDMLVSQGGESFFFWKGEMLLMVQKSLSHYFQGFSTIPDCYPDFWTINGITPSGQMPGAITVWFIQWTSKASN